MASTRRSAVSRILARVGDDRAACEVGVGRRPGVAVALAARGLDVTATDVVSADALGLDPDRDLPGVRFVVDDVVAAAERPAAGDHYRGALVYALNCPPELHRPLVRVAARVGAACAFTTLGGDPPAVECAPVALSAGETLYVARDPDGLLADESKGERP